MAAHFKCEMAATPAEDVKNPIQVIERMDEAARRPVAASGPLGLKQIGSTRGSSSTAHRILSSMSADRHRRPGPSRAAIARHAPARARHP